ncbi:MAG: diadenylate cyclase CdaA [Paludibacteraceae bacterium]|nr:diadenylate cyclase CdaA [Paludibacteraceae bacterium]
MLGLHFGIKDVIDILLVATILYYGYVILRRSGAANLFWGIFAFLIIWVLVSFVFQLELTGALFDRIISVGAIALIVLFQEEIRSFFYHVGSRFSAFKIRSKMVREEEREQQIQQIISACMTMSQEKVGALIVLRNKQELSVFMDTGEKVDAIVSARLIRNLFFKNSPLHDGAMFISKNRIEYAGCILPVSRNRDIPTFYGLRHRAALGLTEVSDATCIVVSEETGGISVAQSKTIKHVTESELRAILYKELN